MELTVKNKKKYTYQDYCRLTPADSKCELIDGDIIMEPAPFTNHQVISGRIEYVMRKFVNDNHLGEVLDAPCDVFFDEKVTVQPDIMFISKKRTGIIEEKNIKGAPDLVVEIISQGSVYRDTVTKKVIYERFGVKEYWIVYPEEELIEIFLLNEKENYEVFKTFKKPEILESSFILPGFRINLREIF
ncbi:MAG: Uma2 family endonuclease [Bacteroidota bacterium]